MKRSIVVVIIAALVAALCYLCAFFLNFGSREVKRSARKYGTPRRAA